MVGFESFPHVNKPPEYLHGVHKRDIHMSITNEIPPLLCFITVPQLADLTEEEKAIMGDELRKYNEDESLKFTVALGEVFPSSVDGTNDPIFQREWAKPMLKTKGSIQKWFFVFGDRDVQHPQGLSSLTQFRSTSQFGNRQFLNAFEYLSVTAQLGEDVRVYDYDEESLHSRSSNASEHTSENPSQILSGNGSYQSSNGSDAACNDNQGGLDISTAEEGEEIQVENTQCPPPPFHWYRDFHFGLVRLLLLYSPDFSQEQQNWLEGQLSAYTGFNTIVLSHQPLSEAFKEICDRHKVQAVLTATEATPKSFTVHEIDTAKATWTQTTHTMQEDMTFVPMKSQSHWEGIKRADFPFLDDPEAHECCL